MVIEFANKQKLIDNQFSKKEQKIKNEKNLL